MRLIVPSIVGLVLALPAPVLAQSKKSIKPADLVGTWVGAPTDSAGIPQDGTTTSDTLLMKPDSTFLWTRNGQRVMINQQDPTDMRWKSMGNNNISWLGGPGFNLKLDKKKLSMVSAQPNSQTGQTVHLAFTLVGPPPAGALKPPPASAMPGLPPGFQLSTGAPGDAQGGATVTAAVTPTPGNPACQVQVAPIGQVLPAGMRAQSPLDSVSFNVDAKPVKVCYGRPSSRGRTMLGGQVAYGKLWRTGANEPTTINTPIPLTIAGIQVPAGIYSLYTVPGATEWEVIINRSISQWGMESRYTAAVQAQEVGRGKVKSESLTAPIETFTMRAEPVSGNAKAASLILEWEKTRVKIPVVAK